MERTHAPNTTTTTPLPMPERLAVNYDNHGSYWGVEPVTTATAMVTEARIAGERVDEWNVTDRAGYPIRVVRIADPTFLDTITVIPADSDPDMDEALRRARDPRKAVA